MISAILADWNTLTHSQRMRRAYELGLGAENGPLIDRLEQGDSFARRLAVQTIYGSRDGERALRLTSDPSRLVRLGATRVLCLLGTSEQVLSAFLAGNAAARLRMTRILVKARRREVFDGLCLAAREAGAEWRSFAPFASEAFVTRHFADAFDRAGVQDWARLARHHPRMALEKLLARARAATERDDLLIAQSNGALGALNDRESDLALQLVRELSRHVPLGDLKLAPLLPQKPEEVARLALEAESPVRFNFGPFVSRLKFETLRELILKQPGTLDNPWKWMPHISVAERGNLWAEFGRGWRGSDGVINRALLECLPRDVRDLEARRHVEMPAFAGHPQSWLPYAALLERDTAVLKIEPFLGDPDPDLRVAAHLASAHNVRFARGAITAHLTLVIAKGNEQDPVRNAMLTGLAGLPPSIWREEHLQQIERIQRQALDARDLSIPAAAQLERILVGLIPLYPGWAALQLAVLVRERGRLSFWSLESRISDDQMRVIGPQIYAVLKSWADRDHGPLLNAMSSFGRRLRAWDPGARLLADFCKTGHRNLALTGAQILSKYRPDIFRELAPELLKQDETWGVKPVIYNYLHLHRQDLWTPALLGRANLEGAFWYSKTRFVLPLAAGFHRWNPLQQQLFAKTLTAVVRDADRDSPGAIWAILRLAALPDVEPATVLQLASLENEKLVLREASLRALCRLDGGQGVPVLVEALDDERARIAVYSLRRALLEMPEGRAIGILRATPLAKVTVAKEVIRLLGELKSPEALELVMEFAGGELHRDVRIALLRALWDHLEDERVWPILEAAAVDSDAAVARMAARTPAVRLTTTARVRLRALRAQLLVHPEPRVRLEVMAVMSLADYDPESLLLQPLIEALGSPIEQEYLGAANAIFLRYATTDAIGQAVAKLRPRRRALQQVLRAFSGRALWSPRSAIVGLAKKIMAELEADPLLDSERIKLAYEFLDQEEFAVKVEDMLSAGRVHPGIWSGLIELLESPRGGRNIMDQLQDLQAKWSSHESPELRRLGLAALVAESRYVYGWNQNRLESLQNYRNDPAPLVASAAQWIFPDGRDVEFPLGSVMEASERDSK